MKKTQILKDMPLYLNGFIVGLLFGFEFNFLISFILFICAGLTLIWYGNNRYKDGLNTKRK